MPVEIQDIGPCKKLLTIHVSKDRVTRELERSYSEVRRTVSIKGFRPGRVPVKLLEKRFGPAIERDLKQNLMQESLFETIEEKDLSVLGEPKVDAEKVSFDKTQDPALSFEVTVQVRPEFELPDLSDLTVYRTAAEVTDKDVDESIEASSRMRAQSEPKEAPEGEEAAVEAGNLVIAQVELKADGVTAREVSRVPLWPGETQVLGIDLPDLWKELEGEPADTEVVFEDVNIPKEAGLEGERFDLMIVIEEIRTVELPTVDDAFAEGMGFDNLGELKEAIRARLFRQREQRADEQVDEALVEELIKRTDFPIPADMVEKELDDMALRTMLNAQMRGVSEEEAQAAGGKVRAASEAEVTTKLKGLFLLDKIATNAKLFATEDDVENAIREMAQRRNRSVDELTAELDQQGGISRLRYELRMDKARAHLRAQAKVIDAENR
jgi:trigger factor